MKLFQPAFCCLIAQAFFSCAGQTLVKETAPNRVVNIVHFIRQCEPRDTLITEDVLVETVRQQIKLLQGYSLPATFLLQYDALINPRYQALLKDSLVNGEIGAWWEITQPHVEAVGLKWRGRFPWDWHANVGFSTGYTPKERELLVDGYMEKFKSIFGRYPATVGSWFIDAHTLKYMYDKYHISASCNMKDQVGTDGYTLWGGYWSNAYYPSRKNAYMPAQNQENQIPVPIFRMLGSDPIYQYDNGLGKQVQHVESLEAVYKESGANPQWVDYFFNATFKDPCLNFTYAQAGQENSFTWDLMKDGLLIQIPKLDSLRKLNIIRVETLGETAKWFKEKFPVTPATATSALTDFRQEGHKTVWYNSRFYRANLLWTDSVLRFRDIHLFNEEMESEYLKKAGTSTKCSYFTLPVIDGFSWSSVTQSAGLKLKQVNADGSVSDIFFDKDPVLSAIDSNSFLVTCNVKNSEASFKITFKEDRLRIAKVSKKDFPLWRLEMSVAAGAKLPFTTVTPGKVEASFNGFTYGFSCARGQFKKDDKNGFTVEPTNNMIEIICRTDE